MKQLSLNLIEIQKVAIPLILDFFKMGYTRKMEECNVFPKMGYSTKYLSDFELIVFTLITLKLSYLNAFA